jgi:hypothetical protein
MRETGSAGRDGAAVVAVIGAGVIGRVAAESGARVAVDLSTPSQRREGPTA